MSSRRLPDDVHIVLRASGERTEQTAGRALAAACPQATVEMVSEAPLSRSLELTLQRGTEVDAAWIAVCDADVVVAPQRLRRGLLMARSLPPDYFVLTMSVEDWLFGQVRAGGLRIYRSSFSTEALDRLRETCDARRPESSLITTMVEAGHRAAVTRECVGVHDRHQWFRDVYRKGYFFAHKHVPRLPTLVERWRAMAPEHDDFRVALAGLADGLQGGDPASDVRAFDRSAIDRTIASLGLAEKSTLADDGQVRVLAAASNVTRRVPPATSWRTEPLPSDLLGQWSEMRRGVDRRRALGEMRSLYDRLGARSLPRALWASARPPH